MYTVKQLSEIAGVSVRTLHYYDEIGLLIPSSVGANGYRFYDDDNLLRLQQVLFYREMGLELLMIKEILDSPDFDLVAALNSHRTMLREKMKRLENLVGTIDSTILHLAGEVDMSKKKLFQGFSEEEQKYYERRARLEYGPENVNESVKRWNNYGKDKQAAILQEGGQIYLDLVSIMEAGKSAQSAETQAILDRWQQHLRYFYEPTLEILRGLGTLYNSSPEFIANFQQFHPDLPAFLEESITQYVDDLETAELERMLAEDEAGRLEDR